MSPAVTSHTAHVEGPALDPAVVPIWIGDIPALGARLAPERTAILFADRGEAVSYAELDRRCNTFATMVRDQGLQPGARIAYLGRNSDLFFAVLIGAIRSGAVLVPINWRLTAYEIAYQLQDSGARWLICDRELAGTAAEAVQAAAISIAILLTEPGGDASSLRECLMRTADAQGSPQMPEQICLQLYTSGTTGNPKGALISHGALSYARHIELQSPHLAHMETGCLTVSAMPNFHSGGLSWALMGLVRLGTVVLTADASPSNILKLIREHRAEHIFVVPTVMRAIIEEIKVTAAPAPAIKGLHYGAMPIGESLMREIMGLLGCRFVQYFGMTEIAGTATILGPPEHDPARPSLLKSVGRPYPGVGLQIRAPDGRLLARGAHGEIWIRTPSLMSGYWRLPDKTSEVLSDSWYASGDGGYLDDDGYLFLTDRLKDVIVSGGENIYPVEVEEALRRHPAVLDVGVVGLPHERWGEQVAAVVEFRPGLSASEAELLAHLRTLIAGYKIPKLVRFGALPRTASGKVQRAVLRKTLQA